MFISANPRFWCAFVLVFAVTPLKAYTSETVVLHNDTVHTVTFYALSKTDDLSAPISKVIAVGETGTINVERHAVYRTSVIYKNSKGRSESFSPGNLRLSDYTGQPLRIKTLDAFSASTGAVPMASYIEAGGARRVEFEKVSEGISRSRWDSTYNLASGGRVRADVRINGTTGTYQTSSLSGTFESVGYYKDGDEYVISGVWRVDRSSGRFAFRVPIDRPNQFRGTYSFRGSREAWNGTRR